MRRKREDKAPKPPRPRDAAAARFALLDDLLLAVVSGLVIVTPLVPSESTVRDGTAAPLNLLWLLALFAWAALLVLRPDPQVKFGWTGVALAALIGWHTLSGLIAIHSGHGRQALNMLWQMVSYGVAAFLLRQLLRTPLQCKALIVMLIAVASALAVLGYYEYFISKPAALAEFRQNPEQAYQALGLSTPAQREHLRWRIENSEPLATFALTNSLAGLLAPWLIALLGILLTQLESRSGWRVLAGGALLAAVLSGCLLLTKSRTAVLAAIAGIGLIGLYGRSSGWRIGWRVPLAAGLAAIVLGLAAVVVGGLDWQVLSEAPTSVLYRLQYWRSTAAIIADDPLFGCGPGQFQEAYALHKLPEASETPRDPHNFLLEIWSTAGTPALLAALAAAVALAWQLGSAPQEPAPVEPIPQPRKWIYCGALGGLALAYPLGLVVGFPPELVSLPLSLRVPGILLFGLPVAAVCVWLLDDWVCRGKLPCSLAVIVLIVLLINLLAAGATSFPGVFLTAWVLAPLALANVQAPAWSWWPTKPAALGLMAASLVLALACMRTEVSPTLAAPNRLAIARSFLDAGQPGLAIPELEQAAREDPWSPEPHRLLANLALHSWIVSKDERDWDQFVAAANAYQQRNPRYHGQFTDRGHWLLLAWRASGEQRRLSEAIEAYEQAVLWYPGNALPRGQLAWALHLAGRDADAARAADEAYWLDARNPHQELKLSNQTIYDPQVGPLTSPPKTPSAEQIVDRLRTSSVPEK